VVEFSAKKKCLRRSAETHPEKNSTMILNSPATEKTYSELKQNHPNPLPQSNTITHNILS
jgi:hypothetical protein